MSFVFKAINTIKKTVEIEIPGDHGAKTKADIDVEFRRLPISQAQALIKKIRDKQIDEALVLRDNVVNIEGIKTPDGEDVPFSKELLNQLLEEGYIRGPMLLGFMDVNYNLSKLLAKN